MRLRTTPMDTEPTRCYPSTMSQCCDSCTRYRAGHALRALDRPHVVLIDGSTLIAAGEQCPMYSRAEPRRMTWPVLAEAA